MFKTLNHTNNQKSTMWDQPCKLVAVKQNYDDLDIALAVHGRLAKNDLQESTFVVSFK